MVRYFFAWMPLVIVIALLVILTSPFLALLALMLIVPGALLALTWAIVYVPYVLGRAVSRRWHSRSVASPRTEAMSRPVRQHA